MSDASIRILHVFGRMGRGGAEMWMMNALRHIDRERFHSDFVVHRTRAGEFDDEIRSLGSAIHQVESYRNPVRYPLDLQPILRRNRYDIVHSHVSHFSGYVLSCARALGVRGRIAHSHTALPTDNDSRSRLAYKRVMRQLIHMNATRGVGCSSEACTGLFGPDWRRHEQYRVLPYGYDFNRFSIVSQETRAAARISLGLADDELVIGHIGRFVRPKNHEFIVELAAASRAHSPAGGGARRRFVLVGDGEARPRILDALGSRGLDDRVISTGQRSDIPELLSSFDVLILPSLWEGLPVTILEAQAAGVPCVISDRVSAEAMVLPGRVARLSLDEPRAWLDTIDQMAALSPLMAGSTLSPAQALHKMNASPFGIDQHIQQLQQIYIDESR